MCTDLYILLKPQSKLGYLGYDCSSNANALDDKHFSSNAGNAMRGRGETKYRINKSERSLCQISPDICTKCSISVHV